MGQPRHKHIAVTYCFEFITRPDLGLEVPVVMNLNEALTQHYAVNVTACWKTTSHKAP